MKSNKLLAVIISLMMLFSFAACDKKNDTKETTKHSTSTGTTKKSSTTKATSTTATSTTAISATTKKAATATTTKKVATAAAVTVAPTTTKGATTSKALPSFKITVNGAAVTNSDVIYCPVYTFTVKVTNSSGTESTNTYEGYKLTDILKVVGATSYEKGISIITTDNHPSTYTKAQIDDAKTIFAITKNGSYNADCPVLAPCSETIAKNYTKNVLSITVL